jgi:ATP-dependent helicase/nuclease subunit A
VGAGLKPAHRKVAAEIEMDKKISLADEAEREIARNDLDRSLAVEAGAGTGKTTLLVDRILSLLRERRAALDEIVALTFTEKAAGELKVRLREAIEKALLLSPPEEAESLGQALGELERAPISTIHSFCSGLLRERPVEASLDPNFEPLDEMGMDLLFQEIWDQWLGKEMEKKPAVLRRALALGMEMDPLSRLVRQIYENRDLLPEGPLPQPSYSPERFMEILEEEVQRAWDLAQSDCRKKEDLGYQAILSLRAKVKELKEASPERQEVILFRDLQIKAQGNKSNWKRAASCDAQKEILKKLARELETLKDTLRAQVMAGLVGWVQGFVAAMEGEKARRGILDFQDLLILSRNLLRDNKEVREYFQKIFRYILVDEFQDTDPLQVEVVFFLAEKGAQANRWEEVDLQPGKLFLVGDPKQSIYRFRRADIETYEKARERLISKGSGVNIVQNFRTVPSILSWVNRVFSGLIQPSEGGTFQPAYVPLVPHPERKEVIEDRPAVLFLAPPPDFDIQEASAAKVREDEAQSVAALIEEMTAGGPEKRWMLHDKKEGRPRPVSYRDMAILFPALTGIDAYEEALKERGIPYRLEGGKEFYMRQEVRSLLCCLKAIDDPADPISLVAALRSPFFGFSDEEIFLFTASGNRLSYLQPPAAEAEGFSEALSLLKDLHGGRNSRPISATVSDLLSRTKAMEFSLLRQGGEQMAANLRKVLEQARAFEGESQATFRRFVEWLGTREEEGAREGESPWSEEGEENVKLMTIHKAKGLEFPVVFLANLASERRRRQDFIPLRLQGTFEMRIGNFQTAGYASALEQEKAKMEAEDRRLFYVAATRARDYLVLPLFWGKRGRGFFSLLEEKLPSLESMEPWSVIDGQLITGRGCFRLQPAEKPPLRLDPEESGKEEGTAWERRLRWKESLNAVKEKAAVGLPLLAPSSALPSTLDLPPGRLDEWTEPSPSRGEGEEGGIDFGLAFHGVMERLDLSGGNNLEGLCRIETLEYSIPGSAEKLEAMVRRCLDHPLMERVRKAKRLFREVPFSVSLEGKLVEGKIDLLFEEEGGWVIVDYKTDDVSGEALDQRFQSYRDQGLWYARAVREAAGCEVKEVAFFFVRSGEIRSIRPKEI